MIRVAHNPINILRQSLMNLKDRKKTKRMTGAVYNDVTVRPLALLRMVVI